MKNSEITSESPSYVFDKMENDTDSKEPIPFLGKLLMIIISIGIIACIGAQIASKIYNW